MTRAGKQSPGSTEAPGEPEASLVRTWVAAARHPLVVAELEGVYEYVAAHIEQRGPACWASGRCCNFERTGHLLYTTGLEAAYTVERVPAGAMARQIGLTEPCVFQTGNLCGVHAIRPLGCRVYFCDRASTEWQQALYERAMSQVRAIHNRHRIEYRYGEWRAMLRMFSVGAAGSGACAPAPPHRA